MRNFRMCVKIKCYTLLLYVKIKCYYIMLLCYFYEYIKIPQSYLSLGFLLFSCITATEAGLGFLFLFS